ncbi:MAG: hypothetical protein IMF06_04315 [Proteobacteria bacterium]|nr:hypothetical protein [Pseudomonadota bacterium]
MNGDSYRTVIKQQHARHREFVVLTGLLTLAAALALGYFLGQRANFADIGSESEATPGSAVQDLKALQEEFEIQRVQHELDTAVLGMVRQEIAAQKEQIANLEEGLRFYKGLMAPEEIAQGLSLRKLELVATEASDRFVFRLVAQQEASKHTTLKGSLSVEVFGRLGEEEVAYPLSELSRDIEDNSITLRFRYFQSIEGELELPTGFSPQGFRVIARASSPRKVEFREQFPWEVQERFAYVGK